MIKQRRICVNRPYRFYCYHVTLKQTLSSPVWNSLDFRFLNNSRCFSARGLLKNQNVSRQFIQTLKRHFSLLKFLPFVLQVYYRLICRFLLKGGMAVQCLDFCRYRCQRKDWSLGYGSDRYQIAYQQNALLACMKYKITNTYHNSNSIETRLFTGKAMHKPLYQRACFRTCTHIILIVTLRV